MNIANFIHEKKDVFNLKTKYPKLVLDFLKKSYEESFEWLQTRELAKRSQGIEDTTHKIEQKESGFVQLEYKEDLTKPIYTKLNFHPKELQAVIKNFNVI